MGHFIGYIKGNRGDASRIGTKKSGIDATARGWNIGGSVYCFFDKERGIDIVRFMLDGGSNGPGMGETIAEFERMKDVFHNRLTKSPHSASLNQL